MTRGVLALALLVGCAHAPELAEGCYPLEIPDCDVVVCRTPAVGELRSIACRETVVEGVYFSPILDPDNPDATKGFVPFLRPIRNVVTITSAPLARPVR